MSETAVNGVEWKNILVGDGDCTFVEVRDILSKSVSAIKLWEKLLDVARSLDIPSEKVAELKRGLDTTIITYPEALYQILESWRGSKSRVATLHNLLLALEKNELNECAAALKKVISGRRTSMGKKMVLFQGQQVQLDEIYHDSTIDEELLTKFARGEFPELVNNQVLDKLEYYIQRKIVSGNRLKTEVLQGKHKDVFLIEGMEKFELTKLVGEKEATDVSGNQILRLTERFIHLEYDGGFEKICKLTSTPVHWIKYIQNGFVWVKSSGSVEALQKYVEKEQNSFDEDDLVSNKDKVVVISDSPGMGKTMLLHSIAHEIMEQSQTVLVRFIVLKELVEALDGKEIETESLVDLIAEQSSEYEYGRELVAHALKKSDCVMLFDGFDEVLPNQIQSAEQILTVAVALKSARVFVTTRPHMRKALENTLHVLGHTIKPFEHQDQIKFLMKYWIMKKATDNVSLQQFATACLETLNKKMTDFEREIAGIPLQCRILAEVYTDHAIRCSSIGYEAHKESIKMAVITSMFDIYEMHMNMRLQKIREHEDSSDQFESVKQLHMCLALLLLFPKHADQLKLSDESKNIPTNQLFSLGIVENAYSGNFRFVHRTFAEYLVAWFVVEVGVTSREFILSHILSTKPNQLYWGFTNKNLFSVQHRIPNILPDRVEETIVRSKQMEHPFENLNEVKSFEFNFPVLCYFINGFAQKQRKNLSSVTLPSILNSNLYNQVTTVFTASAYHDYSHIPAFIASCFREDDIKKKHNNKIGDLLIVTAKQSGVEMMKTFCSGVDMCCIKFLITESSDVTYKFMITPLHVAVRRGHYQMVQYLLNKFEGHYHKLQYLIHFCMFGSQDDSMSILTDKKEIIRLLVEKNKLWGDELLDDNSTPLLQTHVSLELVEFLIQQGADVNVRDKNSNNLLHRLVAINNSLPISPESYNKILLALQERGFQHFNTANDKNLTPLQCAIVQITLLEESVRVFRSAGADFNAVDKQGNSLVFYAIRGGSLNVIPLMIELGANCKHENLKQHGVLHICALHGNYEALQYFLKNYEMDVNAEDIRACTPLHYGVLRRFKSYKSLQILLIEKGADVMARDEMNMTPFDKAFAEGHGLSLNVIQEMEKRGLEISKQLASKALTQLLLSEKLLTRKLSEYYANVLEYLMEKGGEINFHFTQNLWEWEGVQKRMPGIIKNTILRTSLMDKAKSCGLFERLKKGENFYDVVKEKVGSFERVFMILAADEQYCAYFLLNDCLWEAKTKLRSIIFASLPSGVEEFIKSDYLRVFVLVTSNADLSIKRIQDNISKDLTVVEEDDPANQTQQEWIIVRCDVLTDELFSRLVRMRSRVLCVCSTTTRKTGKIARDTFTWEDISTFYMDKIWFRCHGNLFNIANLFSSPESIIQTIWSLREELPSKAFFEISKFSVGHQIGSPDGGTYFSTTIFHYFILDKLAFVGISLKELSKLAKYGQRVGCFGENIQKLDYMALENKTQFGEICKRNNLNLHLIECHEGRFKLLKSRGSHKHIYKFFEEKNLCLDFPSCNCSSEAVFVNLSLRLGKDAGEMLSYCVKVTEIQPLMLQTLNIQHSLEFYETKKLYQHLMEQCSTATEETSYRQPFSNHIVQVVEDIVQYLQCSSNERKLLQTVAVNTVFPEMNADIDSNTMNRFVEMGLLEKKDESLVFHNHTTACYFIAELVIYGNQLDCTHVDQIRDTILSDCFQPHKVQVSHKWWEDSVYTSENIKTFRFSNDMLFKFTESHLSNEADTSWLENLLIPKTKISLPELNLDASTTMELYLFQTQDKQNLNNDIMTKRVHACVLGNHRKLLNIIFELVHHDQQLVSKHIVVLAVMHSKVQTIELVAHAYFRATNKKLQDITLELRNDKTGHTTTVTLLHFAALRGNAGIFQYLLNNFGFKKLLDEPILRNILHFCVIDTLQCERKVEERKQMIECILKVQPNLINATYLHATPLIVPNINISLLMHLINFGADVYASDASSQNIIHLSAKYMTPEEYHQLVNYVHKRGHSKLLHAYSDNKGTPLHTAVKYLEILDTTVGLFHSAKTNFNAVDDERCTVLMQTMISGRSARLLDSLITSGSEFEKYNEKFTALHLTALHGNLTGVRYFIYRGIDVNSTCSPPLHCALYCQQKTLIHGIVQSLVVHGADVNAIVFNEFTPLSIALRRNKDGKIECRTIEFLKEHGAEEFAALKNVNSRFRKLQMEIIDKNMKKLVDNTTCNKSFLDKLTDKGTLTENDVEELTTETDGKRQAALLYGILLRRKSGLLEFMTALHETNQTEPYDLIMTETLNSDQVKSLLRDAVISLDYDAVEYLLKAQRLSNLLYGPFFASIIHDCMDTFEISGPMIDDKLRIIDLILGINPELVQSRIKHNHAALHEALINHGDKQLELIRLLIKHKADVNARDSRDYTPLHYAVTQEITPQNVMEIIKLLIENGADPDAVDQKGCTFLHIAPQFLTPELYAQLIEYFDSTDRAKSFKMVGIYTYLHFAVKWLEPLKSTLEIFYKHDLDFNANAVYESDDSVLFYAIGGGRSASFLNTLISFGADWMIVNKNHNNPLHCAAYYSNLDALKLFISLGCDVHESNIYGKTPLHMAVTAKNINVEVINELIKHGADVNSQNTGQNCKYSDKRTPLHQALLNHCDNQFELIRLLINHKADINARHSIDYTPLHYAVMQKPLPPNVMEITKLLIENGADPDVVDKQGRTFLHHAPLFLTPELYHQLIEYFDSTGRTNSLKMADNHNWTHLHCAVSKFEPIHSTLEIFKKHRLDFNALDNDGDSVVYDAIEGGRTAEFLQTLCTFGADWTILDNNRWTTLHAAAYFGNLSALKLFLSFGCDVNAKNIHGHTPLHSAFLGKRYGKEIITDHEVVDELLEHGADLNARDNREKLPIDLAKERAKIGKVEEITVKLLEAFST